MAILQYIKAALHFSYNKRVKKPLVHLCRSFLPLQAEAETAKSIDRAPCNYYSYLHVAPNGRLAKW